jgi:hypothetical protein
MPGMVYRRMGFFEDCDPHDPTAPAEDRFPCHPLGNSRASC